MFQCCVRWLHCCSIFVLRKYEMIFFIIHEIWLSVRYQELSVCLGRYMIDKNNHLMLLQVFKPSNIWRNMKNCCFLFKLQLFFRFYHSLIFHFIIQHKTLFTVSSNYEHRPAFVCTVYHKQTSSNLGILFLEVLRGDKLHGLSPTYFDLIWVCRMKWIDGRIFNFSIFVCFFLLCLSGYFSEICSVKVSKWWF